MRIPIRLMLKSNYNYSVTILVKPLKFCTVLYPYPITILITVLVFFLRSWDNNTPPFNKIPQSINKPAFYRKQPQQPFPIISSSIRVHPLLPSTYRLRLSGPVASYHISLGTLHRLWLATLVQATVLYVHSYRVRRTGSFFGALQHIHCVTSLLAGSLFFSFAPAAAARARDRGGMNKSGSLMSRNVGHGEREREREITGFSWVTQCQVFLSAEVWDDGGEVVWAAREWG